MTQINSVHVQIRCFQCGQQLGYYEVMEGIALDEIPLAGDFTCKECVNKEKKQTEALT